MTDILSRLSGGQITAVLIIAIFAFIIVGNAWADAFGKRRRNRDKQ